MHQEDLSRIVDPEVVRVLHQILNGQHEMMEALAKLSGAFPGGDSEGHRRYHEAIIENTAEKRRLRIAIQEKTISGVIWAGVVWLAVHGWDSFVAFLRGLNGTH